MGKYRTFSFERLEHHEICEKIEFLEFKYNIELVGFLGSVAIFRKKEGE